MRRVIYVLFFVAILFSFGPRAKLAAARDEECSGNTCPVCQYSNDPGSDTQTFGGASISVATPAPSYPTGSITYCIEKQKGPGDILPAPCLGCPALLLTYEGLQYNLRHACQDQTYCDENGVTRHCKYTHENIDPPRAYPPTVVEHDGVEYLHGCFKFNCEPPVPPMPCATPTPTPPPTPTEPPPPTATPDDGGGGRLG